MSVDDVLNSLRREIFADDSRNEVGQKLTCKTIHFPPHLW